MSKIFKVNYSNDWDSDHSYFLTESTFTVADWILMDLVCDNPHLSMHKVLPHKMLLRLFFNVLPGGNTFLHKLVLRRDDHSLDVIRTGFKVAKEYNLELPMMVNNEGRTPLDIVLDVDQPLGQMYQVPIISKENDSEVSLLQKKTENLLIANLLLENIKDYSFLHSGPDLSMSIVKAV